MNKEYLIYKLSDEVKNSCKIDKDAFKKFNVKRGLRNEDGSGVLVGLTNIGNVVGYERDAEGKLTPTEGKLYYRGYELDDLVTPLLKEKRFGFEEVAFLLLSGQLPDKEELDAFKELLNDNMPLDHRTITHIIELEGSNIMNILARCVLEMYTFDPNPDDISRDNLMRQSIELIAKFPTIIAYAYNIYRHSVQGRSLHIRHPRENLSIAENFLYMMKHENYSELDARMLDLLLIIQAEHGGGNNSTFTVRVTSSTRTDTYSSIAAGIGSLKGPLHGGANIKVVRMMNFGVFVELLPGKDGMVHISKLAKGRVEKCEDVVKIGDELEVKVAEIDSQGRINLIRNDIEYDNTEMPRRSAPGQRPPRRDANRR